MGRLDEIELVFNPGDSSVEVLMEVDRRGRGLWGNILEQMGADETMIRFVVHGSDVETLSEKLKNKGKLWL